MKDGQKESSLTHTRCPGTPVYMPPEALMPGSVPNPTEKMGVLMLGVTRLPWLRGRGVVRATRHSVCRRENIVCGSEDGHVHVI